MLAIADELTQDGLVLRYRAEDTDDGLPGEEGTFTICSFWLVSALAEIGEHHRARDLCEKVLSYASPLLLYAEEIEASVRPAPGQLPAGFHPPGPYQRGHARHRERRGGGQPVARRRVRAAAVRKRQAAAPRPARIDRRARPERARQAS